MLIAILCAVAFFIILGIAAAWRGPRLSLAVHLASAIVAGALALAAAVALILEIGADRLTLPLGLPWLGAHFRLDALSQWFVLVINLGGAAAAIYGREYVTHLDEPARAVPLFPAFLGAMNLVLVADDAFVFLLAWESMSLSSWLLVLANHRQPGAARAAMIYLVMAALGTACLLLAFGVLAGFEGQYRFDDIRDNPPSGLLGGVAVVLIVLGAGSKAGLVPMHAWLPLAHPAAPSHVSALMSGVMTKVAIYGLVRLLFDLSGPLGWGWGVLLLGLGGVSALLGILYALMERDLKTLLACSTIENIGVIVIGLGLTLVFEANGLAGLAALAFVAAMLHVLNHALMKSLMFFVAGAIQTATGTRDLERLGGLIHRLPRTALLALIGAAAISALPPFNGFVSEWLIFQAVLNSPSLPQWALKFGVPVIGATLALAAALAASCFVRVYGIAFLGRPRSPEAAEAREVGAWMQGAMTALAALCLAVGIAPAAAIALIEPSAHALLGQGFTAFADGFQPIDLLWLTPLDAGQSSYSGAIVLVVVTLVTFAVVEGIHRLASADIRRAPPWDCGFPDPHPATQYSASSFAQPLRRVFATLIFRAHEEVDMPEPGDSRQARLSVRLTDPAWAAFYAPVGHALDWLTLTFNALQYLTIRRYLTLVFVALVLLLSVVVLAK